MSIFRSGKWAASFQDIPKVFSSHFYWIQALLLIWWYLFQNTKFYPTSQQLSSTLLLFSILSILNTIFLLKNVKGKRKLAHCCWLLWMDVRDNPGNCPQTLTSCSRSLLLLDRWCLGGSHRDQFWELLKSINWTKMNLFSSTQSDHDLQVTGILAKQLDLDHKELNSYWTMNSSRLMATKLQQSPLTYHKDLVAGPTDRCGK